MAKKGLENFTDKVAKELIQKQSIRDEQRRIREEYLANKHKEATDLTNEIQLYIDKLDNIINTTPKETLRKKQNRNKKTESKREDRDQRQ